MSLVKDETLPYAETYVSFVLTFCGVFYIPTVALKLAMMSDFYCYLNIQCLYRAFHNVLPDYKHL